MKRKNFLLLLFAIAFALLGNSCEDNFVISDDAIIETCKTPNASYGKPYKYAILISWKTSSKSKSSTWYYTNKELCPYVGLTLNEAFQRYYDSQRRVQHGPTIENRNTNEVHIYNYAQRDSLSP